MNKFEIEINWRENGRLVSFNSVNTYVVPRVGETVSVDRKIGKVLGVHHRFDHHALDGLSIILTVEEIF